MAEIKDKVINVETLKAVYDDLRDKISLDTLGITVTAEELNQLGGQESPIKQQFEQINDEMDRLSNDINNVNNTVVDIIAGKGSKSTTVVLSASGWSEKCQTIQVEGVSTDNTVFVSPSPSYMVNYGESGIVCSEQRDNELVFTCLYTPATDIYVNILVMNIKSSGLQNFVLTAYTNVGADVTVTNGEKTFKKNADHKGGASFIVNPGLRSITSNSNGVTSSGQASVSADTVFDILVNTIPAFTYTGEYEVVDDDDNIISRSQNNWKIRFLTSGTLVFNNLNGAEKGIDVFCVGGGAGGNCYGYPAGGGGSGYTTTTLNQTVAVNTEYVITVGNGGYGADGSSAIYGGSGERTSAFGAIAEGGLSGSAPGIGQLCGGSGGSGGGSGYADGSPAAGGSYATAGPGGVDGSNGQGTDAGVGQGSTTREFGESTGKLYATGGSGIEYAISGAANTGDGGSGGFGNNHQPAGSGGSGIAVIRNARNNRVYLYNNGDTCENITGGYIRQEIGYFEGGSAGYDHGPVLASTSPQLVITSEGANWGGTVRTAKKINLTNYKTLTFTGTITQSDADHVYEFSFCVWSEIGNYAMENVAVRQGFGEGVGNYWEWNSVSLDVSSLSGNYYVGFAINTDVVISVDTMYLE